MAGRREPGANGKPSKRGWSSRRLAALVVAFAVTVGLLVSWFSLTAQPPRVVRVLDSGRITLYVPILVTYAFPALGGSPTVETSYRLTGTEPFTFRWLGIASEGTPVEFVFRPPSFSSYRFEEGEDGTFRLRVVGAQETGTSLPGVGLVENLTWEIDYLARRLSAYAGFFERQWVEIQFTPNIKVSCGCHLPSANTSWPTAADLLPTGVVDSIQASGSWNYSKSLAQFALPPTPFHHAISNVSFPIGIAGRVVATLDSWFAWGPLGDYRTSIESSGTVSATVTWFWDTRFGGLYPVVT